MMTAGACQPEMIEQLHEGLMRAAQDGRLPMEWVDASKQGILVLKMQSGLGPATGNELDTIQSSEHFRMIVALDEEVTDRREQE
jgi:hypothetical protein